MGTERAHTCKILHAIYLEINEQQEFYRMNGNQLKHCSPNITKSIKREKLFKGIATKQRTTKGLCEE